MRFNLLVGCLAACALAISSPQPGWRLIQTGEDPLNAQWMAPEEVEKLSDTLAGPHHGVPFMDITEHPEVFPVVESGNTSQAIYSANEINHAMSFIDLSNPEENLQYLTGVVGPLQNRRHNTADGAAAARWIRDIMQGYCDQLDRSGRCSVSTFTSPRTPQLSVILRREGSNNPNRQVVIIGGHLDSIAGSNVRAPGADDDGSGTVTVMEAARAFLAAGTDNALTLEFQLYAAEEVGLGLRRPGQQLPHPRY